MLDGTSPLPAGPSGRDDVGAPPASPAVPSRCLRSGEGEFGRVEWMSPRVRRVFGVADEGKNSGSLDGCREPALPSAREREAEAGANRGATRCPARGVLAAAPGAPPALPGPAPAAPFLAGEEVGKSKGDEDRAFFTPVDTFPSAPLACCRFDALPAAAAAAGDEVGKARGLDDRALPAAPASLRRPGVDISCALRCPVLSCPSVCL